MEQRQHAYQRRASQHDDLEESRSRHEMFRSSMFSTNPREVAPATRPLSRGGTGAGGGSVDYAEDTTAARIDAAINAAMAVDATRGANTFNQPYFTPQGSTTSMTGDGGENGGMSFSPAPAPPQGGGGGVAVIPPMPSVPVVGGSRGSGSTSGGHTRSGYSGHASGGSGGGAYKSYHPSSGSHPSVGSMPGLVGMSNSTGYGSTGHAPRAVAPVEESVASPSLGQRSGSSGAGSFGGGAGSGRGNGHGNGVASTDPFSFSKPNNSGGGGGGFGHIGGHVRAIGSGGSGGGAQQQQPPTTRSVWERGGAAPTPKAVWQPEPPAPVTVVPGVGGDDLSSEGSSGRGGAAEQGGGQQYQRHQQYRDDDEDDGGGDHDHYKTDSSGALPPPDQRSPDIPPLETGSGGGSAIGQGGMGGGGEGVEMTPTGYEPPLELPDGCHHISLEKFLEVMTGPGLRVRKHHRSGKGSSGLRVLRYNQEGDSLTWDSHKILGAAQHVLPMGDVESVSMQPGNRVVLMCVGGKDSYAVFEAANDDAAAVLYVGLERLRERTQASKDSV